jgi:hypothetical protein
VRHPVVADGERPVEPHDHVEEEVADRGHAHGGLR